MDSDNLELACGLISSSYIQQGAQALASRRKAIKQLLSSRRLPDKGWCEDWINALIAVSCTYPNPNTNPQCTNPNPNPNPQCTNQGDLHTHEEAIL